MGSAESSAAHLAATGPGRLSLSWSCNGLSISPADVRFQWQRALGLIRRGITSLRARRMRFVEPGDGGDTIDARWLDLVLMPLVGFDADDNRLGMGAGFYDRKFAFLRHRRAWHRPLLLGIAFDAQRMERFDAAPHDVPLWGVVTERAVYGRAASR